MEINITSLLEKDQFSLSHSVMEGGDNAGRNTWKASLERAEEVVLLDTEEKLEAFKDWTADFGAWSEEERNAWTPQEANALFLQWIAGDCREAGADSLDGIDWDEYQERCEEGQCASNLFKGDDGQIYFSLSH
jgi:hypothetical protein